MSTKLLVTGAAGRLGTAVCQALIERGYDVRATDRRFERGFPTQLELGDLCDELFVYRTLQGCEAVVHLGNHPNPFAGPSAQRLLSENTAMNANVFHAAADLGVRCIVFASSVQVMIKREKQVSEPPYHIPYLPLDGDLAANPGRNTYAQSKEFAERMLRLLVEGDPELSATSIRFPMLVGEQMARRMQAARFPLGFVDFAECTAHLFLPDAGRLVESIVSKRLAGYHQYFPAAAMDLSEYPVQQLLRERYPEVLLKKPINDLAELIDISALMRDLGWTFEQRLRLKLDSS